MSGLAGLRRSPIRYQIGPEIVNTRRLRGNETLSLEQLADYGLKKAGILFRFESGDNLIFAPIGKEDVRTLPDVHCDNGAFVRELVIPLQFHQFFEAPAILKKPNSGDVEFFELLIRFSY